MRSISTGKAAFQHLDRNAEATHQTRCIKTSGIRHQHPAVYLLTLPQPQEHILFPPPTHDPESQGYRHFFAALRDGTVRYILKLGNAGMTTAVGRYITWGGQQGVGAGTWRGIRNRKLGQELRTEDTDHDTDVCLFFSPCVPHEHGWWMSLRRCDSGGRGCWNFLLSIDGKIDLGRA